MLYGVYYRVYSIQYIYIYIVYTDHYIHKDCSKLPLRKLFAIRVGYL